MLFAMAWVGGTASMPQIMSAMQVDSLATASFISGAVTIAKIVGTFLAAWLAIKVGIKNAFLVSCLLVVIGIFTPIAPNFDVLLISRFLMGLGGALMIVYFNPIVMALFEPHERSTINGLNAVAFNVGTAIVLWFMSGVNELSGGWQQSLVLFSVLSLILTSAWLFVQYDSDLVTTSSKQQEHESVSEYTYLDGVKDSFNWIYALSYSGLLAFYICLFTFYPQAGIVASKWVIGFGIVGTLAGIIYSKKVVQRIPVIRLSGLIQALTVVGLSFSTSPTLQIFCAAILGFFIFLPVTALVTIPHELPNMTGSKITVVFSLFWSISYLVATMVLWLFGKLVDLNDGDFSSAFFLISGVSCSLFVGSFFLPETHPAATLKKHAEI